MAALVKHQHQIEGINSRLDGLQAAILSAKLPHLPAWTAARQARREDLRCRSEPGRGRGRAAGRTLAVTTSIISTRSGIRAATRWRRTYANGVQTAINYPTALPLLAAYARFGHRPEQFPNAFADQGASCRCRCSPRSPPSSSAR